jgi:Na+-driven multidrug efflux pump
VTTRDPTHAAISAEVDRLAVPAVIHNLLLTGVFLVDAVMVGWLGTEALAAVAIAGPVIWGIRSLFHALGRGTLAMVARAIGAGDHRLAGLVARESLALALIASAAATPLAAAAGAVYAVFGTEPRVAEQGARYLGVLLAGLPASIVAQVMVVVFQAAGDTRTPMLAGVTANLVNVVANYVLMFGALGCPALGTAGAAAGTVIAHAVMVASLGGVLIARRSWIPRAAVADPREPAGGGLAVGEASGHGRRRPGAEGRSLGTRAERLAELARIGSPVLAEAVAYHTAYLVFCRLVSGLGTHALAAHRIAISVESLAFMPADGFNVAAATITGQRLGAGRPQEALRGLQDALRKSMVWMLPLSAAFAFAPRWITTWFTAEPGLTATAAFLLRIAAVEVPFLAATSVMVGGLQGAGDTASALRVTLAGAWLVRLPSTYLLGHSLDLGVAGVWLATTADWAVRTRLAYAIVRRGAWLAAWRGFAPAAASSAAAPAG